MNKLQAAKEPKLITYAPDHSKSFRSKKHQAQLKAMVQKNIDAKARNGLGGFRNGLGAFGLEGFRWPEMI